MAWRWPWATEKRESSYTDAFVSALVSQAAGTTNGDPAALAVLEAAAGLWSRAFAAARLEPEIPAVTPAVLAMIGRDLIRRGDSLFLIGEAGDALRPVGSWDIRGAADEAEWFYRCDRFGPSRQTTAYVPSDSVLHFRFAVDAARPWRGLGPLQWARSGASLAANAETRLAEEASGSVARVIPMPKASTQTGADGETVDPSAAMRADIASAKGRALIVETTSGGHGDGRADAPQRDWKQERIGPDPSDSFRTLHGQACEQVMAACGVPMTLLSGRSDGTAMREGWRQLLHGGIRPVARTVAAELASKFDLPGVTMNFEALYAHDLAGRAQSFQRLVAGGMAVPEAVAISGLVADSE